MIIDMHVHLRDENLRRKETIERALRVAEKAGLTLLCDQANNDPVTDSEERALYRIALAQQAGSPVIYTTHVGLSKDPEQVKRAIAAYRKIPEVVALKLFAGNSTGNLGVVSVDDQFTIYQTLASEGFEGVVVVHCEKESRISKRADGSQDWDYARPITHALSRPASAEIESISDQLLLANEAGYTGRLHIPHASLPASVWLVASAEGVMATCDVTPHHIYFDFTRMEERGLLLKVNPPLREVGKNTEMLRLLREGYIDMAVTDHAPHTPAEKQGQNCASGLPGIHIWPLFLDYLRGHGFTEQRIKEVTFDNPKRIFNLEQKLGREIAQRQCVPEFDRDHPYQEICPYRGVLY